LCGRPVRDAGKAAETNRLKKIAVDAWQLNVKSAIIDSEVIVPATDGVSDFSMLQNELRGKSKIDAPFGLLRSSGADSRKPPSIAVASNR
jgi:bifunctional non-homologous end joining protein LigD